MSATTPHEREAMWVGWATVVFAGCAIAETFVPLAIEGFRTDHAIVHGYTAVMWALLAIAFRRRPGTVVTINNSGGPVTVTTSTEPSDG